MKLIDKLRVKYEICVAKGVIAEIMSKANWDINNLDSVEYNKVKKMSVLIGMLETNM